MKDRELNISKFQMMYRSAYLLFSLLLLSFQGIAQVSSIQIPVSRDGDLIVNPFAGGVNIPQLNEVDLDLDGVNELLIFDRTGNAWLPLKYDPSVKGHYRYAPEFLPQLPKLNQFVLFRDYNKDGLMDIFANSLVPGVHGVTVFTGKDSGGKLYFEEYDFKYGNFNVIYYPDAQNKAINLYVSEFDYPDVSDMDGDGDLDIVAFESSGGYVHLYQNMAIENGESLDSMHFRLADFCWGNFLEPGNHNTLLLSANASLCADLLGSIDTRHAGSTLMSIDLNNDGAREMLIGDLSFSNIVAAYNTGTATDAFVSSQDTTFPNYDLPVNLPVFPVAFNVDVDRDGSKDLVFAPNIAPAEDRNPMWYYNNTTGNQSPVFHFSDSSFVTSSMIDFGTASHPAFADVNGDGLIDMILAQGEKFIYGGVSQESSLNLFLNTGTSTNPAFTFSQTDWAGLRQYSLCVDCPKHYAPAFGDIDDDGDQDLFVGEFNGYIIFLQNIAGPNQSMAFASPQLQWLGIDVGQNSSPCIFDINQDGLLDLIVGERNNGNINYFQNVGTKSNPVFDPIQENAPNLPKLGLIDTRNGIPGSLGCSAPLVYKENDIVKIMAGTSASDLKIWKVNKDDLGAAFELLDGHYGQISAGDRVKPAMADLDLDGFNELLCGNMRGGFTLYHTDIASGLSSTLPIEQFSMDLFPNPAHETINLVGADWSSSDIWNIYNSVGQLISSGKMTANGKISIADLNTGYYVVQVFSGNKQGQISFIKGK
ncbi:MAG: T9SS type A sorting domain-containing protein [Saprospiraceae bacterium]